MIREFRRNSVSTVVVSCPLMHWATSRATWNTAIMINNNADKQIQFYIYGLIYTHRKNKATNSRSEFSYTSCKHLSPINIWYLRLCLFWCLTVVNNAAYRRMCSRRFECKQHALISNPTTITATMLENKQKQTFGNRCGVSQSTESSSFSFWRILKIESSFASDLWRIIILNDCTLYWSIFCVSVFKSLKPLESNMFW